MIGALMDLLDKSGLLALPILAAGAGALIPLARGALALIEGRTCESPASVLAGDFYGTVKLAPQLGLAGTCMGIMQALAEDSGNRTPSLSLALATTVLGLAVAMPLYFLGGVVFQRLELLELDDCEEEEEATGPVEDAEQQSETDLEEFEDDGVLLWGDESWEESEDSVTPLAEVADHG